jgi:hypothetical protein
MLPVFSPDFCGVMSVFVDTGALMVFHGQGGCVGNFAYADEIRWQDSDKKLLLSRISEAETVTGGDEIFMKKMVSAIEKDHSRLAVITSSPIAMITGIDIPALAKMAEKRTGIPVLGINSHGFKTYEFGQELAYQALYEHFLKGKKKTEKRNAAVILGATSLDGFDDAILQDFKEFLHEEGYGEILVWGMNGGIRDVEQTINAAEIFVVSGSAISTAKLIREEFGIPFRVGIPMGRRFREKMEKQPTRSEKVLVLAEQVTANSVREYLEQEKGMQKVTVASMFTMHDEWKREGDIQIACEDDLKVYGEQEKFDYIIADHLFQQVITAEKQFINLPHTAVSGWVNTEKLISVIGKKADDIFCF